MKPYFLQFLFMLCCIFYGRAFNVCAEESTNSGSITPELRRAANMTGGKVYHISSVGNAAITAFDLYLQTSKRKIITLGSIQLGKRNFTVKSVWIDSNCTTIRLGILIPTPDFELVLWDPKGNHYKPDVKKDNTKCYEYDNMKYYEITAPQRGVWGLGIFAKNTNAEKVALTYYAIADTSVSAAAKVKPAVSGKKIILTSVSNHKGMITGAKVSASISHAVQGRKFITLYDDGKHNDDKADDGIYGNTVNCQAAGKYTVICFVEGKDQFGGPFYRQTLPEYISIPETQNKLVRQ